MLAFDCVGSELDEDDASESAEATAATLEMNVSSGGCPSILGAFRAS
jgi:hypothetical protein